VFFFEQVEKCVLIAFLKNNICEWAAWNATFLSWY